jgi:hypothetical protein
MTVIFAEQELHNACKVLFGADLQVSQGFLNYLQLSGIKSAYRKKALETHPDRLARVPSLTEKNDLFMAVQQAYESLISFIDARKKGYILQADTGNSHSRQYQGTPPQPRPAQNSKKEPPRSAPSFNGNARPKAASRPARQHAAVQRSGSLHTGPIPDRKLLFGHYLYYSGLVNWQTIIKALVWQRTRRPRIGEIGCRFGWLTTNDIYHILKKRSLTDSFGQSAVQQGYLTVDQLRLIVFQQKRLQKKFGEYFVAHNILTKNQVDLLVQQFRNHNYAAGSRTPRYRTM